MAWISVHEQLLGGKLRCLAKKMESSQNEALGVLVRFWLWGINNADPSGMILGATKGDVIEVLSVGLDKRISADDTIEAMIKTGWIDIESNYLYIHDWEEWQKQWYKVLQYRKNDAKRKRIERAEKKKEENRDSSTDISNKQEEANTTTPQNNKEIIKKKQEAYTSDFEDFWNHYPRKIGKGEAYRKYKARLHDGWSPKELETAAKNYAMYCVKNRVDKDFIKHPKTFLSDATPFIDYLPKAEVIKNNNENYEDPYSDWR